MLKAQQNSVVSLFLRMPAVKYETDPSQKELPLLQECRLLEPAGTLSCPLGLADPPRSC